MKKPEEKAKRRAKRKEKAKKQKEMKKPREQFVYCGHRERFKGMTWENNELFVTTVSGEKVKADMVFSQIQYTRDNGKVKVLSRETNKAVVDIPEYLCKFHTIWIVDTNSKQIGAEVISISCVLYCFVTKTNEGEVKLFERRHATLIFKNCPNGDSERYAWSILAQGWGYVDPPPKCAIVTDHDMCGHSNYNARTLPIYQNIYLPRTYELIYASDAATSDNPLNMLIKRCDTEANEILRELKVKGCVTLNGIKVMIDDIPDMRNA